MIGQYVVAARTYLRGLEALVRVSDTSPTKLEDPPLSVRLRITNGSPGTEPAFTPTEARKLADALYNAARVCEVEIARRTSEKREAEERARREKIPILRDPEGFVWGSASPLWFIAREGEVLGYFSRGESAQDYVLAAGSPIRELRDRWNIGPITAARHRAFAELLDAAAKAGV